MPRLREWERSRRLTHTSAANTPCWASLGELGWEGCADEEILLSSCELRPPSPGSPSLANPPPAEKPKPPALPPQKKIHQTQKRALVASASPSSRAAGRHRTMHSPVERGRRRRGSSSSSNSKSNVRNPPLWRGMSHLTPCLVHRFLCPTPMVSTRGLRPPLLLLGGGGVEYTREKEVFSG